MSSEAQAFPHCGAPRPGPRGLMDSWAFGLLFVLFVGVLLMGAALLVGTGIGFGAGEHALILVSPEED